MIDDQREDLFCNRIDFLTSTLTDLSKSVDRFYRFACSALIISFVLFVVSFCFLGVVFFLAA